MNIETLKQQITYQQIYDLVEYLNGQPQDKGDHLICKTICHCGNSHKLYYYQNTHLFKCYTACNDAFDEFELVSRVQNIQLPQAIQFVCDFLGIDYNDDEESNYKKLDDWQYFKDRTNIKEKSGQQVDLKIYNQNILKHMPQPRIKPWQEDGISYQSLVDFNIKYDPVNQGIVIPHYDLFGRLVGVRERTLVREAQQYGKYLPAIFNKQQYNHPLGFNLYGINRTKTNIQKLGKVIVFESEKSVLQYNSHFGSGQNIAVATCGSNLTSYQFTLLYALGVKEIVIAFDRQWQQINDEQYKRWTKKLIDIAHKYGNLVTISFIHDSNKLLPYKASPIDIGKQTFLKLFKMRKQLK